MKYILLFSEQIYIYKFSSSFTTLICKLVNEFNRGSITIEQDPHSEERRDVAKK